MIVGNLSVFSRSQSDRKPAHADDGISVELIVNAVEVEKSNISAIIQHLCR